MNSRGTEASTIVLADLPIHNCTLSAAVDEILARAKGDVPRHVCFVNAHCVNVSRRDSTYREVLQRASRCYADGVGMKIAGRMMSTPLVDNVNGTDMFPLLCERMAAAGTRLYLLGAKPGVVDDVVAWIQQSHPTLVIAGYHHGYFHKDETTQVIETIRASNADVLLVAMGVPVQEHWIDTHLNDCGVRVAMGVGGLFDFYSGRIPRAPKWMRSVGLEWLFRFAQEPGRLWQRYWIGNAVFMCSMLWVALRKRIRG